MLRDSMACSLGLLTAQYSSHGRVITGAFCEKAEEQSNWSEKKETLGDGFKAIVRDPLATQDEKALAKYGMQIAADRVKDATAAKAMLTVMEAIHSAAPGPVGSVIAKMSFDAAKEADNPSDRRDILHKGLHAVADNPGATEEEKERAGEAIEKCRGEKIIAPGVRGARIVIQAPTEDEALEICLRAIEEIKKPAESADAARTELEHARERLSTDEHEPAIEIHEGFVTIDGLTLNIRKD